MSVPVWFKGETLVAVNVADDALSEWAWEALVTFGGQESDLMEEQDFEPWFAEEPGQKPPVTFSLITEDGQVFDQITVFPLEPWTAWDAIEDRLMADGWTFRGMQEVAA